MKAKPAPTVAATSTPVPDISTPLKINQQGPNTPPPGPDNFGPLQFLVGNWNSQPAAPNELKGYNVMPLPQATAPNMFIVRDFGYYEELTIGTINGNAPNRGGVVQQNCAVLFYDQRVYFGEGSPQNQLVHAENGSWLYLTMHPQLQGPNNDGGPIPSPPAPNPIPQQDPNLNMVKQVSVPHGNSILSTGSYHRIMGPPTIGDVSTLPYGAGVTPSFYTPFGSTGPSDPNNHSNLMVNPNFVLQQAIQGQNIAETIIFTVSTKNPGGSVTNIDFETKRAHVQSYTTTVWLERLEGEDTFNQLQYTQTIELTFIQNNVTYIHIDANTLTRIPYPNCGQ
jgi:hypothetical protein